MRTECIYLIGCEASTLVKIGRSIDVPARLAALQAGSPVPLMLLWQTLGGSELEAALHRRFEPRRAHGEWFDFPGRDAPEQIMRALPEIAAGMQQEQRARRSRRAQAAAAMKMRKIRAVWSPPSADTYRRAVLDLAAHPDGVTNRVIVKELGVSSATALRYLGALNAEGFIEMRGRGRATAWHATVSRLTTRQASTQGDEIPTTHVITQHLS